MPSFATTGPITATVDLAVGEVRVDAGEQDTAVVEVRPTEADNHDDARAAEQTRVELADGVLRVRVPKLRSWLPRTDGGSVDVAITLPAGSALDASGAAVDVTCAGRLGDCRVKTSMGRISVQEAATAQLRSGVGDITVDRVSGRAEVVTGSGELRLHDVGEGSSVKNANGATWVGAAGHGTRVNAANGAAVVDHARGDLVAKSANGDVRLGAAAGGSVVLETQLGDVEVGVPAGTAAWLDLSATAGRVTNTLEAAEAPGAATATVQVRARTSVGEILVRRS